MALVFLNAMKELPTTLLLSPTGFKTLPLEIWMANSDGRFAAVGAPTLVLVAVSAVSLALMLKNQRNG
jgi:iron(III) transport system permease protein